MKYNFHVWGIDTLERREFIGLLRQHGRRAALVFVHGYNTSFKEGAFRLAQIVWDGQLYELVPLLFSWPSKNDKREYPYDVDSADYSVTFFIQLLELLQKDARIKTVHIIAHSIGNRIVLNAISNAVDKLMTRQLGEVVLAAADVDRQRFIQIITEVRSIPHGMTLYASVADAALWWSAKFASGDHAGTVTKDGPIVVEGVESIDMTSTNPLKRLFQRVWQRDLLGLNTHNTFVSPVIVDVARLVMKSEHPPHLRTASIRGVPEGSPRYWRYTD